MACQSSSLGLHFGGCDLEQLSAIFDWILVQAASVRLHPTNQACSFALLADRRSFERFLCRFHFSHHGLDVGVRQRLFPQMGQRLLN